MVPGHIQRLGCLPFHLGPAVQPAMSWDLCQVLTKAQRGLARNVKFPSHKVLLLALILGFRLLTSEPWTAQSPGQTAHKLRAADGSQARTVKGRCASEAAAWDKGIHLHTTPSPQRELDLGRRCLDGGQSLESPGQATAEASSSSWFCHCVHLPCVFYRCKPHKCIEGSRGNDTSSCGRSCLHAFSPSSPT